MNIPNLTMSNGVTIPQYGYGTFKMKEYAEVYEGVLAALANGIRAIDTAAIYGNEAIIGKALKASSIERSELFITSKLWNDKHHYDDAIAAFEKTCADLQVDYLDLYLVHWPKEANLEAWRALEDLYSAGKIRSIGVSNFKEHHLDEVLANCRIKPMMNQVEFHPQFQQESLREYCAKEDILITGWGPLMQGKVFEFPILEELAKKHHKNVAQIVLRWHLQQGVVLIPKSSTLSRIKENLNIFDFELTSEDIELINTLNTGERIGPDPDTITF